MWVSRRSKRLRQSRARNSFNLSSIFLSSHIFLLRFWALAFSAVGLLAVFLDGCAAKKEAPFTDNELVQQFLTQGFDAREIDRGVVVNLPATVLFAYDSADLSPESRQKVDILAKILNHPRASLRHLSVEGHADAIGSEDYNLKLSQRRAETVSQELIADQVHGERLQSRGFGKLRPVEPNTNPDGSDNPEGRAKNRRVELIIEKQ